VIGDNVTISSGALVDGAYIGNNSIVAANAQLFPGHVVGEGCFIGPGAVFCNDSWPRASKAEFPGFICATGFGTDYSRKRNATIVVGDGASIGANATILPGIIIGEGAMVAAGSVCGVNVPGNHVFYAKDDIRRIKNEKQRLDYRCRSAQYRDFSMEGEC
jgi:acetyltransferase-like isoleucine patch superfamily enzyme